jgi:hypothetical protein
MIPKNELPSRFWVYLCLCAFLVSLLFCFLTNDSFQFAVFSIDAAVAFVLAIQFDEMWTRDCQRADFRAHLRHLRNGG